MSMINFEDNNENRYVNAIRIETGMSFIFTKEGLYEFIKLIDDIVKHFKINIEEYHDDFKVAFGDKNDKLFIDNHIDFIQKFKKILIKGEI